MELLEGPFFDPEVPVRGKLSGNSRWILEEEEVLKCSFCKAGIWLLKGLKRFQEVRGTDMQQGSWRALVTKSEDWRLLLFNFSQIHYQKTKAKRVAGGRKECSSTWSVLTA